MKIQSLSVVVPAKKCVNDCMFCVSKMHDEQYEDMMSSKNLYYDLYKKDYSNRLIFARDNGCNTVMLTGDCEPTQNRSFLARFGDINKSLPSPFKVIEIQTAGNLLTNDMLYFLRHHVGVTTISVSVSDLWSNENNVDAIGCEYFDQRSLYKAIKKYRFNLRLSLNMTDLMLPGDVSISDIFEMCKLYGADQVTFRKMYSTPGTDQSRWLEEHEIDEGFWSDLNKDLSHEEIVDKLEYGRTKYNVRDMGVVVDNDCMGEQSSDVAKYLILRPNAKLYSKWDTKASLIF